MRRVVLLIGSCLIFAMVLAVALVSVDMRESSFPSALNASASATLDFSSTNTDDQTALDMLARASRTSGVTVYRVIPSSDPTRDELVYANVGIESQHVSVPTFRPHVTAQVQGMSALQHSYASGQYLVSGHQAQVEAFRAELAHNNVGVIWVENDAAQIFRTVAQQADFMVDLASATLLLLAMILFLMLAGAQSRTVRILNGASPVRILVADFLRAIAQIAFLLGTFGALGVIAIAIVCGTPFVAVSALAVGSLLLAVTLLAVLVGVPLCISARERSDSIAKREPSAAGLRNPGSVFQTVAVALVLASASPAFGAFTSARDSASEQAQWLRLGNWVNVQLAGAMGETGFQANKEKLAGLVAQGDARGDVALSYAWSKGDLVDLGFANADTDLILVNHKWLTLMGGAISLAPTPFERSEPSKGIISQFLSPNMELWRRGKVGADPMAGLEVVAYNSASPLASLRARDASMMFSKQATVIIADDLSGQFDAGFLGSILSSRNLVFNGLSPTMNLVATQGLTKEARVVRAAEEGVLRAQYAAYILVLRVIALVCLVCALVVSASVTALINASKNARRDFVLGLSGVSPLGVVRDRISFELGLVMVCGMVIVAVAVHEVAGAGATLLAGVFVAIPILLANILAVRWTFARSVLRQP